MVLAATPLTGAQRRYVVIDNGVGAFIVNFIFGIAGGWLVFRSYSDVPLWGRSSIVADTIGTCLLLPLITCVIVTALARYQIRSGKLVSLLGGTAFDRFPANSFWFGLLVGSLSIIFFIPLILLALRFAGIEKMHFHHFLFFKAGFAGLLAACVTPFLALRAISLEGRIANAIATASTSSS